MVQLVKRPTLDFGSGHDLAVHGIEPCIRLHTVSVEPIRDSLSPSLSAPPFALVCFLSFKLSIKKKTLKRKKMTEGPLAGSVGRACDS